MYKMLTILQDTGIGNVNGMLSCQGGTAMDS